MSNLVDDWARQRGELASALGLLRLLQQVLAEDGPVHPRRVSLRPDGREAAGAATHGPPPALTGLVSTGCDAKHYHFLQHARPF